MIEEELLAILKQARVYARPRYDELDATGGVANLTLVNGPRHGVHNTVDCDYTKESNSPLGHIGSQD
jgi:hypothetical protein